VKIPIRKISRNQSMDGWGEGRGGDSFFTFGVLLLSVRWRERGAVQGGLKADMLRERWRRKTAEAGGRAGKLSQQTDTFGRFPWRKKVCHRWEEFNEKKAVGRGLLWREVSGNGQKTLSSFSGHTASEKRAAQKRKKGAVPA